MIKLLVSDLLNSFAAFFYFKQLPPAKNVGIPNGALSESAKRKYDVMRGHTKFESDSVPFTFYLFTPLSTIRSIKENHTLNRVIAVLLDLI